MIIKENPWNIILRIPWAWNYLNLKINWDKVYFFNVIGCEGPVRRGHWVSGFSCLCPWLALPECSLGWNSCVDNFVVRKSCVMTLGAPLTPWLRRFIKAQGVAPWSFLEPSCRYTFASPFASSWSLTKIVLKMKLLLNQSISITNLSGGCTTLLLLQLIFWFVSWMPIPEHPEQLLSSQFSFARLSQCARGRRQESLKNSFRICSCLSGGGRWGNPWGAYISSYSPCKTTCQSSCAVCVGSQGC